MADYVQAGRGPGGTKNCPTHDQLPHFQLHPVVLSLGRLALLFLETFWGSLFLAGWLLMGSPFLRYLIFRSLYSAKCCSFIDFPDSKYLSTSLVSFFLFLRCCTCGLLLLYSVNVTWVEVFCTWKQTLDTLCPQGGWLENDTARIGVEVCLTS